MPNLTPELNRFYTISFSDLCDGMEGEYDYETEVNVYYLEHGIVVEGDEPLGDGPYLDFHESSNGPILCMDGETCEVLSISDNGDVELLNVDGEFDTVFFLSAEEFSKAAF